MKNIVESNKLIAEFLNVKMHPCETIEKLKFLSMEERGLYNGYFVEDLKYHEDWNWLMKVVEKIESLDFIFEILSTRVDIADYRVIAFKKRFEPIIKETKIEAVYNACVEFIKWYNEQK